MPEFIVINEEFHRLNRTAIVLNANRQPEWIGKAPWGAAKSDEVWVIDHIIYDANGDCVGTETSKEGVVFNDYLTVEYNRNVD